MALKEAYSTTELLSLLELSFSSSIIRRAEREGWQSQKCAGRGGGKEWLLSSMPEDTRLAIRAAEEKQAMELAPATTVPALSPTLTTAAQARRDEDPERRVHRCLQGRGMAQTSGRSRAGIVADAGAVEAGAGTLRERAVFG